MKFGGRFQSAKFRGRFSQKFHSRRASGSGSVADPLVFQNDLTLGSLTSTVGPALSFTRTTATTSISSADLITQVSSGQPRWWRIGAGSGVTGLSIFGASTERLLWNNDLTNAAWTKGATATAAMDQTGPDGVANSASSLTGGAVSATNTCLQAFTLASSARYQSTYIKRLVGTGTIEMTTDGGTTWVDITASVTAGWTRVSIAVQTVTNPSCGFRITTNADKIAVAYVTNRAEIDAPVIGTTTAQVTVNADNVATADVTFVNASAGTIYGKAFGVSDGNNHCLFALGTNGTNSIYFANRSTPLDFYEVQNGGVTQASISNNGAWLTTTARKVAFRYAANDFAYAKDNVLIGTDVSGTIPAIAALVIGADSAAGSFRNGVIQEIRYYNVAYADAPLQALTQ